MKKIILTGFKPFLGADTNPSEIICNHIVDHHLVDLKIIKQILPVDFSQAYLELNKIINEQDPHYIVMLGVASGREKINLEKIGLNWNESKKPDENQFIPASGPIYKDQLELALMTRFPVDKLLKSVEDFNYPIEISFSAGTFVCNNLYYKMLRNHPNIKSVFIHVVDEKKIDINYQIQIIQSLIDKIN